MYQPARRPAGMSVSTCRPAGAITWATASRRSAASTAGTATSPRRGAKREARSNNFFLPGRVWCWTLVACCTIPPHCAKKPAATVDAIPPHPLPPAIPNWVLEAICDECGCDECGCDECGASGAAATHRHGHAGLYVGAGCHVTLQVQADRPSRPLAPSFWWSERGVAGYRKDRWARGNLRGGRPIPSLPASTRREAGSTHTLPLILGSSTIPYRAKIRNP